jgi:tetratricopeptide (TPR) repeat protein
MQNLAKDAGLDAELHLVRFNMANAAFNAESWDLAEKEYQALVQVKLPEFMVYRNLSYIYKQRNDMDALRTLWNQATDNFDGSTELGRSLALEEAVFYQEIGELEVLIEKLRDAINLDPTNASLYNVLGGIYTQKIVDHNNALSDETADQTKKLQDDVYTTMFADAEKLLLKAQELDAKEPTNFTQLGSLYLSEGLVAYNQNQRLTSSKSDLAKGKVLTEKYRASFAKAQVQFEKGLEVDDKNKAALEYLSKIHIWNGDLAKSMEYKNRLKELEG